MKKELMVQPHALNYSFRPMRTPSRSRCCYVWKILLNVVNNRSPHPSCNTQYLTSLDWLNWQRTFPLVYRVFFSKLSSCRQWYADGGFLARLFDIFHAPTALKDQRPLLAIARPARTARNASNERYLALISVRFEGTPDNVQSCTSGCMPGKKNRPRGSAQLGTRRSAAVTVVTRQRRRQSSWFSPWLMSAKCARATGPRREESAHSLQGYVATLLGSSRSCSYYCLATEFLPGCGVQ